MSGLSILRIENGPDLKSVVLGAIELGQEGFTGWAKRARRYDPTLSIWCIRLWRLLRKKTNSLHQCQRVELEDMPTAHYAYSLIEAGIYYEGDVTIKKALSSKPL